MLAVILVLSICGGILGAALSIDDSQTINNHDIVFRCLDAQISDKYFLDVVDNPFK